MPEVYDAVRRHRAPRWKSITATCRTWSSPSKNGKLYMLQTRNGKRTAAAALKIAVDLVRRGHAHDRTRRCCKVEPKQLDTLLHPQFDAKALCGREAGCAAGCPPRRAPRAGMVCFTAADAKAAARARRESHPRAGWRPRPRTSRACTLPRASSPARGGMTVARGRRRARHGHAAAWRAAATSCDRTKRRSTSHVAGQTVREGD